MEGSLELVHLYRELAEGYARRGQPQFRDRFLVLAAATALDTDEPDAAEDFRRRLLSDNPHHLLKPYVSFTQAMRMPDVQAYVSELRKDYPQDVAKAMLESLRDLEGAGNPGLPVTAPLLDLGGSPDLLMDDEGEPLKILSFRDESPSGVPPTLPPDKFPASPSKRTAHAAAPHTLFEAELPPALPPAPKARPARPDRAAPPAANAAPVSKPRRANQTPPPPTSRPAVILAVAEPTEEPEAETIGAWVCIFLFGVAAAAGVALLLHSIAYPYLLRG